MSDAPPNPMTAPPSDAGLHRKPALAPVFGTACLVAGMAILLIGARAFAPITEWVLRLAAHSRELRYLAVGLAAVVAGAAVIEHLRRVRPPRLPLYLLANRAVGYGLLLSAALHAILISRDAGVEHLHALLFDPSTQLIALAAALAFSGAAYAGWLHPLCDDAPNDLPPYQLVVDSLKDTYDFVLGVEYPSDWKRAAGGDKRWLIFPEHSLWTNLFVFGGIDSGKTSSLAYPLVIQALVKHKDDPALRPSVVLLDLKGDNALRVYDFCRKLGRADEFWVISPGNAILNEDQRPVLDAKGRPVIPRDRFLTWNPIGGHAPADLRASLLLDGLASTNDGPKLGGSAEYFENVEAEFLSATVQILDLIKGPGKTNLLDVYRFAYDPKHRLSIIEDEKADEATAKLYFQNRFQAMKPEDQGHLIAGLTAKLAKLTSPSVRSTFCPKDGDDNVARFPGFLDLVVNRPGVIVFSVPEAIYSRELSRVLGIMFMRAFHTEVLRRSTTQFAESGGNTKRLVMNVVDECWAFMNKGVASFTAVSRQARACSVFLTQSLDQIPENYRATVEGNFRTKALLSVNDSVTLKRFEDLLGTHKEMVASASTNASLQGVRHGVFTPSYRGKDQGLSQTTSISEQLRPRFSQHEIQHLPRNRAVVHLYTKEGQREAVAMEVTPWFLLRHYMFQPLAHPDLACGRHRLHDYASDGDGARCARCGHRVDAAAFADVTTYARHFGHLLNAGRST